MLYGSLAGAPHELSLLMIGRLELAGAQIDREDFLRIERVAVGRSQKVVVDLVEAADGKQRRVDQRVLTEKRAGDGVMVIRS